jgi:hypothetical protein
MHTVTAAVPCAAGDAGRCKLRCRHPKLLGQLATSCVFRHFSGVDAATRQMPASPIGGANQQERSANMNSDDGPLVPRSRQMPPAADKWIPQAVRCPPSQVDYGRRRGSRELHPMRLLSGWQRRRCYVGSRCSLRRIITAILALSVPSSSGGIVSRSRRNSSVRARIAAKSSATRGLAMFFLPSAFWFFAAGQVGQLLWPVQAAASRVGLDALSDRHPQRSAC